jgi:hypothetical protein
MGAGRPCHLLPHLCFPRRYVIFHFTHLPSTDRTTRSGCSSMVNSVCRQRGRRVFRRARYDREGLPFCRHHNGHLTAVRLHVPLFTGLNGVSRQVYRQQTPIISSVPYYTCRLQSRVGVCVRRAHECVLPILPHALRRAAVSLPSSPEGQMGVPLGRQHSLCCCVSRIYHSQYYTMK